MRLQNLAVKVASALLVAAAIDTPARAMEPAAECRSEDNERRITGCTALIESPGIDPDDLAVAYAMRALAFSLKTEYDRALPDYDEAIRLKPDFAIALNNRAWAQFKAGRASKGLPDVEKALELSPGSPHALDTRAHIRQSLGQTRAALSDYELAMRFGGERMVKLYQCGLQSQGLYGGDMTGRYTIELRRALESCVAKPSCDPLPADEECRRVTS